MIKSALLVLEDGTQFHGRAIGATGSAVGEVVFNTSMTGYQEILTDPSYSRQIVTLTYPHIGNVGTNDADEESSQVHAQGLVIRDLPLIASNFRNTEDLSSYLKRHNIVAIADIDTRKLTRLLREKGAQNGCIIAGDNPDAALALEKARAFPGLNGMDLAKEVTTAEAYSWTQGSWTLTGGLPEAKKEDELPFHVVACDFIQAQHPAHVGGQRLSPDHRSGANFCGRCAENESRRHLPLQRSWRPGRAITPLPPSRNSSKPIFRSSASASVISCWRWRAVRRLSK